MELGLDDTPAVAEFRCRMRNFAERELAPHIEECERLRRITSEVKNKLVIAGCFNRVLPKKLGGLGGTVSEHVIQQEELGRVWVSAAALASVPNLASRILLRFANHEMQEKYVRPIGAGELLAAVAFTEPEGGSDPANARTVARRESGGYRLFGAKRLIDNTALADIFLVMARTDDTAVRRHRGLSLFVVERGAPGLTIGEPYDILGERSAGVGSLDLDGVAVGDDAVVGDLNRGFYQMMGMVEFGRTNVAAICTGLATGALEHAKTYAAARRIASGLMSDNQVTQSKIADMAVSVDAARLLTYRAAKRLDDDVRCDREASIAKLFASEAAVRVTSEAMQIFGGIGLTTEYPIERMFRDSRVFTIGEGTSEVQRMIIGRREFETAQGAEGPVMRRFDASANN